MSTTARFVALSLVLAPIWTLISEELPTLPIRKEPPPVRRRRVSVTAPELKPTVTAPLICRVWPAPMVMTLSETALRLRTVRLPKRAPPLVRSREETTVELATLPKMSAPFVLNWLGAVTPTVPVLPRMTVPLPETMLPAGRT